MRASHDLQLAFNVFNRVQKVHSGLRIMTGLTRSRRQWHSSLLTATARSNRPTSTFDEISHVSFCPECLVNHDTGQTQF